MSHKISHRFRNLSFFMIVVALSCSACAPRLQTDILSTQIPVLTALPVTSPAPTSTVATTAVPLTPTPLDIASSSDTCSSLRSVEGSVFTSITFVNESGRAVNVYWVNYQGAEEFWFELKPGQSQKQKTYVTHAWCARDQTSNTALLAVVATEDEQVATLSGEIQWQETTSLPIPSSAPFDSFRGQQLIFHNGRVYLFGGRRAGDDRLTNVYFSAIQPDGTLGEWNETTPLPGKYYDHVVVKVGDYVYLLTGADGSEDVYFALIQGDGSLGAWKETAPLSPSRQTFAAASAGNFIYTTGGNSGGTQAFVQYTSVDAEGGLNRWSLTMYLPEPIQEHAMIAYDGYLYVIGGKKANDAWTTSVYFSAIQPGGRLADWKTTTSVPGELHGAAAFEANGYVYLLSSDSSYSARILDDHTLGEWQTIPSLPTVRNGLRVGAYSSYAYAVGGSNFTEPQNTVYYAPLGSALENPDCTSGWTRLEAGSYAKVSEDQPSPNRVREAPDTGAEIIYQMYPGSILRVLEGPVCTEGLIFWKVEHELIPGGVGWTAEGDGREYYLEPNQ